MRLLASSPLLAAASGFVWQEHIHQIIITALLSMVPAYEGRYAIPVALKLGMPAFYAYLLAFVASSIPLPFILLLLRPVLDWFYTLPIKPVRKFAAWVERHAGKKHEEMRNGGRSGFRRLFSSETAELVGLYIFVALPLPGTGVWTGSAIADQEVVQTPTLPAGSYKLSVNCASDNGAKGVFLIAGNQSTEMIGTGNIGYFSVNFDVSSEQAIKLGVKLQNTTATWINFDNFCLQKASTSSISVINTNTNDNRWYSLDGRQMTSRPTTKGIYIHGGKKVVIK